MTPGMHTQQLLKLYIMCHQKMCRQKKHSEAVLFAFISGDGMAHQTLNLHTAQFKCCLQLFFQDTKCVLSVLQQAAGGCLISDITTNIKITNNITIN